LGLNPKQESERAKKAQADDISEMFASGEVFTEHPSNSLNGDYDGQACGDCVYWDSGENHCTVHLVEKSFDDDICRQFSPGEFVNADSVM
jgi:hypothetical protein